VKNARRVVSDKIHRNAKDIHAVLIGISVVFITTAVEFVQRHYFKYEAGSMIYGALALTLTSRIIGVILRRVAINDDEPNPPKKKKRRRLRKYHRRFQRGDK
jgi:hypothetical protein